ncbi:MAG: hypothetical protein D6B26_04335, partial [Spirochaetaceae bacterium]
MNELPDVAANWLRYRNAFTKAYNREFAEFADNYQIAAKTITQALAKNPFSAWQSFSLWERNQTIMLKGALAAQQKLMEYIFEQMQESMVAGWNSVINRDGMTLSEFMQREAKVMEAVANFAEDIEAIADEFGFQLDKPGYDQFMETPCFSVYQVMPTKKGVKVNNDLKPVLLVAPYLLGAHILSFLPGEDKSYAHAFANEGIPTYVRIVKNITITEAVQTMTPEDDCTETAEICTKLAKKHGQKVTLNGICQGGYIALLHILSGRLTDCVDSLITVVAPIDGTYNTGINSMPRVSSDYLTVPMPSGNRVANGFLLSMGMRMIAIEREQPLVRVLSQAALQRKTNLNPGKTVAALFRWLLKERVHLPLDIAQLSSVSFYEKVTPEGILPVKLFGKTLDLNDLKKLKVKWYQGYAIKDDLVTPECATGANHVLEGSDLFESAAFFGGHVAILTSPYAKQSPVNGEFTDALGKPSRGPVKFQL